MQGQQEIQLNPNDGAVLETQVEINTDVGTNNNESAYLNRVHTPLAFTALLRPSDLPLKPTVWAPSAYKTVTRLVTLRFMHRHHLINENMKKDDWADGKIDPNRWSQLKKIYNRIKLRIREIGVSESDKNEWKRAAIWLDANEKQEKSIPNYIVYLRQMYYSSRTTRT